MKGGILYSNYVTTVSPNHADEVLYDAGACGLSRPQRASGQVPRDPQRRRLRRMEPPDRPVPTGLLLGRQLGRKKRTKGAQGPVLAAGDRRHVVAYVGRLDEQKGMHLIHHALFYTLAHLIYAGADLLIMPSMFDRAG